MSAWEGTGATEGSAGRLDASCSILVSSPRAASRGYSNGMLPIFVRSRDESREVLVIEGSETWCQYRASGVVARAPRTRMRCPGPAPPPRGATDLPVAGDGLPRVQVTHSVGRGRPPSVNAGSPGDVRGAWRRRKVMRIVVLGTRTRWVVSTDNGSLLSIASASSACSAPAASQVRLRSRSTVASRTPRSKGLVT